MHPCLNLLPHAIVPIHLVEATFCSDDYYYDASLHSKNADTSFPHF